MCPTCGAEFDPMVYQVIADGLSYHSVECAIRALERDRTTRDHVVVVPGEAEAAGGRAYSIAGALRTESARVGARPRVEERRLDDDFADAASA